MGWVIAQWSPYQGTDRGKGYIQKETLTSPDGGEHASDASVSKTICRNAISLISGRLQGSRFYKAFSCLSLQTIDSFILGASGQKQMVNDDSSGSTLFLKNVLDPAQSS